MFLEEIIRKNDSIIIEYVDNSYNDLIEYKENIDKMFETKKIVYKNIVDLQRQKSAFDCFENYQFPFSLIPADSRIALYGAGEVGKAFFGQMELLHYAEISLWADRDYEKLQKKGFLVEAPAELLKKEEEYSHVIVAIESKKTADGIINELKKMGIPGEKLVWSMYRKAKK